MNPNNINGFTVFRIKHDGIEFRTRAAAEAKAYGREVIETVNGPHHDAQWARDRAGIDATDLRHAALLRHFGNNADAALAFLRRCCPNLGRHLPQRAEGAVGGVS